MKKKNCRYDWVFPVVMIISFFFILPFLFKYYGWFDFLEDEKFNPEENVCIDKNYLYAIDRFRELAKRAIEEKDLTFDFSFAPDIRLCKEWRPKNECEKGNPEYIEELKCTEFFQQKEVNLTIYGCNLTIEFATANEEMYACGKYKKVCTIKMKTPNNPFNAAKMEITWGDNTHSVYKDGIYVGEIKEGDDTSWVR